MNILNWIRSLFAPKPVSRPDNTGVLIDQRPEDYVVGANSPIAYQERLRDGNWTPYAFDQEKQYSDPAPRFALGDSMSCVSHSSVNVLQAQEYFITGKKVNYSKRWIAKMSGTTVKGNYLNKVADTIRKYGLVLEEDYPAPKAPYSFEDYHADIPESKLAELEAKGQEWLKRWKVQYEFISNSLSPTPVADFNLDYHLKHAPLVVVIPGHAVSGIYSPNEFVTYLDSYPNWIKQYPVSGLLQAMKLILIPTWIEAHVFGFQGHPELWVALPMDSMQRLALVNEKLPEWLPDYFLNTSRIKTLPIQKPSL